MNGTYKRYLESHFIRIKNIRLNLPSRKAFEYMAGCYLDWCEPYLLESKSARISDFGRDMGLFLFKISWAIIILLA